MKNAAKAGAGFHDAATPLVFAVQLAGDERAVAGGGGAGDARQLSLGLRSGDRLAYLPTAPKPADHAAQLRPNLPAHRPHGFSLRRVCDDEAAAKSSRPQAPARNADSGSSSAPTASSSDPPPMMMTNSRPVLHPNQRRAARNVNRAPCSLVSSSTSTPVRYATPRQDRLPVARAADRAGGEGQHLTAPMGRPIGHTAASAGRHGTSGARSATDGPENHWTYRSYRPVRWSIRWRLGQAGVATRYLRAARSSRPTRRGSREPRRRQDRTGQRAALHLAGSSLPAPGRPCCRRARWR